MLRKLISLSFEAMFHGYLRDTRYLAGISMRPRFRFRKNRHPNNIDAPIRVSSLASDVRQFVGEIVRSYHSNYCLAIISKAVHWKCLWRVIQIQLVVLKTKFASPSVRYKLFLNSMTFWTMPWLYGDFGRCICRNVVARIGYSYSVNICGMS